MRALLSLLLLLLVLLLLCCQDTEARCQPLASFGCHGSEQLQAAGAG